MLALLLATLTLSPSVPPPILPVPETAKASPHGAPKHSAPAAEAAPGGAPEAVKPKVPARKTSPSPAPSEAEARAAKLLMDNALLQQEMARALGSSFTAVTTPAAALAELSAGNARFMAGKRVRTLLSMQDNDLRGTLAKGQAPSR